MSRLGYHYRGYIAQGLVLRNVDVFIFPLPPIMLGAVKEMAVDISLLLVLLVCWGGHWTHGQGSRISCIILSSLGDDCARVRILHFVFVLGRLVLCLLASG